MKRITLLLTVLFTLFCFNAFAGDAASDLQASMAKFFKDKNMTNLSVKVEVLKKLDNPKGMFFVKMILKDAKSGRTQEQFVFTDGNYIVPEIIDAASQTNIKDRLIYDNTPKTNLDVSKLTFMEGNKNSKNVIVKVSDFQCPYCRKAYAAVHEILGREKVDAAVYMMHLPLSFHPKAMLYAKIFEAGLQMGKNFGGELYSTNEAFDKKADDQIIEAFAQKSGNPAKFKSLVTSKSIADRIEAQTKIAASLGITGTPQIYFNGKPVAGYNPDMYYTAIKDMK